MEEPKNDGLKYIDNVARLNAITKMVWLNHIVVISIGTFVFALFMAQLMSANLKQIVAILAALGAGSIYLMRQMKKIRPVL